MFQFIYFMILESIFLTLLTLNVLYFIPFWHIVNFGRGYATRYSVSEHHHLPTHINTPSVRYDPPVCVTPRITISWLASHHIWQLRNIHTFACNLVDYSGAKTRDTLSNIFDYQRTQMHETKRRMGRRVPQNKAIFFNHFLLLKS